MIKLFGLVIMTEVELDQFIKPSPRTEKEYWCSSEDTSNVISMREFDEHIGRVKNEHDDLPPIA